jgi:hypothetical protein
MKARSILTANLPTSLGTLYTVPDNIRAKWVLAFVSNGTGSTISNVVIQISNGVTIKVLGSKSLSSGDFVQLESNGGYVMLEPGTTIQGSAGSTGVSCILTVEELPFIVSTV